jgi:hypothetical protein
MPMFPAKLRHNSVTIKVIIDEIELDLCIVIKNAVYKF